MKTITITGIGKLSVKPDLIVISMQLDTENKEYDQAMLSASEKINALNKSLEELGFSKDTLKTTNFNVRTIYENVKDETGRYKNVFKGYSCIHNLKLEFDFDTKQLSKVLSRISACIAKPELSILFTIKDKIVCTCHLDFTRNVPEQRCICNAYNISFIRTNIYRMSKGNKCG